MSYALTLLAPQTSGHPMSLPANPSGHGAKIAPIAAGQGLSGGSFGSHNSNADGSRGDRAHVAPPSMLQIKINTVLQEQAEAQAKDEALKALVEAADKSSDKTGQTSEFSAHDAAVGDRAPQIPPRDTPPVADIPTPRAEYRTTNTNGPSLVDRTIIKTDSDRLITRL